MYRRDLLAFVGVTVSGGCLGFGSAQHSNPDVGCSDTGNLVGDRITESPPSSSVTILDEYPPQETVRTVLTRAISEGYYTVDLSSEQTEDVEQYLLSLSEPKNGVWYVKYNGTLVQLQFSCDG